MEKPRSGKFSEVVQLESGRGLNQLRPTQGPPWKATLWGPSLGSGDKTRDVQLLLKWSRAPRGEEESPKMRVPQKCRA